MSDLDFSKAKYTAIISDLHLCEAEPIHLKYPLWKKYKTKEFFFDDDFALFLKKIQAQANYEPMELVLNGDIFDFDSITSFPEDAIYKVSWLEKIRGLKPREERSLYKISKIIEDHPQFFQALKEFLEGDNKVIFIFGNHDVELHFAKVQAEILKSLNLTDMKAQNVRFNEWFYISNQDTLIEHGNQYDPYCVFDDPINPLVRGYNYLYMKLPFGNIASRYIMNGMGFFNPHSDGNYIMNFSDYVKMFTKYMLRAQPFLILTWFMGAVWTLFYTIKDQFAEPIKNPLSTEERVNFIAHKANASPRQVRELKELFVENANKDPMLIMKELWLDRAFIILISFIIIYWFFSSLKDVFGISLFWGFIPLFLMIPFFLFYTKSIVSLVSGYKEPDDKILAIAGYITGVSRVVFGHTHISRHEMIGSIEHLNSGTWSPSYLDIECTQPTGQKTSFGWSQKAMEKVVVQNYRPMFRIALLDKIPLSGLGFGMSPSISQYIQHGGKDVRRFSTSGNQQSKKLIKEKGEMNTSAATVEVLSKAVERLCLKGIESAKADGRKTVMDRDIIIDHI